MHRQHPIFSPVAITGTILLLAGLAYGLYTSGGWAFSPGNLSAMGTIGQNLQGYPHHAAFGQDCGQCHAPFQGVAASRCERCHVEIGEQRVATMGLHGRLRVDNCATCHLEHKGADFDSVALALGQFTDADHAALFPLIGAHTKLECVGCHEDEQYAGLPTNCLGCHAEPELHQGLLGTDCAKCHTPDAWLPAQLMAHPFELDHGEEGQIACATCHTDTFNTFTCAKCHTEAEIDHEHDEVNISAAELANCATCHPAGIKDEAEWIMGER